MDSLEAVSVKISSSNNFYCDIGFLALAAPSNLPILKEISSLGVLGFKGYLIPPGKDIEFFGEESLNHLFGILKDIDKPVLFHPELTSERFLYMSSPFRNDLYEDRKSKVYDHYNIFAAAIPEDLIDSPTDLSPMDEDFPAESKLENMFKKQHNNIKSLVSAEIHSYKHSGVTTFQLAHSMSEQKTLRRPPAISTKKEIQRNENREYRVVLANSSPHWESNAVKVLSGHLIRHSTVRLHISNVCAGNALYLINNIRSENPSIRLTCETTGFYLCFDDQSVHHGDTRFKVNPPIRETENRMFVKELLDHGSVDSISSYHRPIKAQLKATQSGDFKIAVPGISSLGYSLQACMRALQGRPQQVAALAAKLLSENPAKIIGLSQKGTIEAGKHADLIVWDPNQDTDQVPLKDPWISPFSDLRMPGKVLKTYLRGKIVYESGNFLACGKVLVNY